MLHKFFKYILIVNFLFINSLSFADENSFQKTKKNINFLKKDLIDYLQNESHNQDEKNEFLLNLIKFTSLLNGLNSDEKQTQALTIKSLQIESDAIAKFIEPEFVSGSFEITFPSEYLLILSNNLEANKLYCPSTLIENKNYVTSYFIVNYLNELIYSFTDIKNINESLISFNKTIISSSIFYLLNKTKDNEREAVIRYFSDIYGKNSFTDVKLDSFKDAILKAFKDFKDSDESKTLDKYILEFGTDDKTLNRRFIAAFKASLGLVKTEDIDVVFSVESKIRNNKFDFTKEEVLSLFNILNTFASELPQLLIKKYFTEKNMDVNIADIDQYLNEFRYSVQYILDYFIKDNSKLVTLVKPLGFEQISTGKDLLYLVNSSLGSFTKLPADNEEVIKISTLKTLLISSMLLSITASNESISIKNLEAVAYFYEYEGLSAEFKNAVLATILTIYKGGIILKDGEANKLKKFIEDNKTKLHPDILYQFSLVEKENKFLEFDLDKYLQETTEDKIPIDILYQLSLLKKDNKFFEFNLDNFLMGKEEYLIPNNGKGLDPSRLSLILNHSNSSNEGNINHAFINELPLLVAYEKGFKNIMLAMLALGADPNIYDANKTPFIQLVLKKYYKDADFLKKLFKVINKRLNKPQDSLISIYTMETIIEAKNVFGFNTIDVLSELASISDRHAKVMAEILIYLKSNGWKDSDKQDRMGTTCLHRSVFFNAKPSFIKELKKFITPELKDINGLSYSDYLILKNYIINDVTANTELPTSEGVWGAKERLPGEFNLELSKFLTDLFRTVTSTQSSQYLVLQKNIINLQKKIEKQKINNFNQVTKSLLSEKNQSKFVSVLKVKLSSENTFTIYELEALWKQLKGFEIASSNLSIPIEVYKNFKEKLIVLSTDDNFNTKKGSVNPFAHKGKDFLKDEGKVLKIEIDKLIKRVIETSKKSKKI